MWSTTSLSAIYDNIKNSPIKGLLPKVLLAFSTSLHFFATASQGSSSDFSHLNFVAANAANKSFACIFNSHTFVALAY